MTNSEPVDGDGPREHSYVTVELRLWPLSEAPAGTAGWWHAESIVHREKAWTIDIEPRPVPSPGPYLLRIACRITTESRDSQEAILETSYSVLRGPSSVVILKSR